MVMVEKVGKGKVEIEGGVMRMKLRCPQDQRWLLLQVRKAQRPIYLFKLRCLDIDSSLCYLPTLYLPMYPTGDGSFIANDHIDHLFGGLDTSTSASAHIVPPSGGLRNAN